MINVTPPASVGNAIWAIDQWRAMGYHDDTISLMLEGISPGVAGILSGREEINDRIQRLNERKVAGES
ncbi:hypothetical protein LCGC14_2945190 [marine sediment metagenome]|uniref:Uncharacterized protein n=1 Tax=marine sediment metagenome TaxID=412755 RepID=A0A0F8ZPJ3_9ZZZZ